jgi:hypothetical protein
MDNKILNRRLNKKYDKLESLKINHILHLLLSLLTGGLWIIVWVLITMSVNSQKKELELEINNFEEYVDTGKKPKRELDIGEKLGLMAFNGLTNMYKKIINK